MSRRTGSEKLAPRARFELAIRRGELTAAQEDDADPLPSLAGLEFSFPAHGGRAGGKLLGVEQAPGSCVTLSVDGQSGIGGVMLGEATLKIGRLADIGLALRVQKNVDGKCHKKWLPGLDSN